VLWLTAALSAIVMTVALTTRTEVERAGTNLDSAQAYYLAEGSIERFMLQLRWPQTGVPNPLVFQRGQSRMRWDYPSGSVDLEVSDEGGKISVVSAPGPLLARLFVVLGVPPDRAGAIAGGIVARREAARIPGAGSSFSPRGASLQQLEDILTVPGMTPDIFYGWWERNPAGRLLEKGGVLRHLTTRPGLSLNVNYASPQVLLAAGLPDGLVAELVARREIRPLDYSQLPAAATMLPSGATLTITASQSFTVRATALLKRRPVRRTATALVRLGGDNEPPVGVVRWRQSGD
jgi:type II secretory pathway component PulK